MESSILRDRVYTAFYFRETDRATGLRQRRAMTGLILAAGLGTFLLAAAPVCRAQEQFTPDRDGVFHKGDSALQVEPSGPIPEDKMPVPAISLEDVTLSPDDAYIFPSDRPVPVKLRLTNNLDTPVPVVVDWKLEPFSHGKSLAGRQEYTLAAAEKKDVAVEFSPLRRDMYRFTARVLVDGTAVSQVQFPLLSTVPLPSLKDVPDSHFGLYGHLTPGTARLGLKWIRVISPSWTVLEPKRDQFDWQALDRIIDTDVNLGGRVIFVAWGTPEWASSLTGKTFDNLLKRYSGDAESFGIMVGAIGGLTRMEHDLTVKSLQEKAVPNDWQDYRDYLTALLKRYNGRISAIEAGNEVDGLNQFFGSPAEYVRYLKETYETVKAVDPKVQVLGLASYSYQPTPFVKKVFDLGGLKYMDVYSWHAYHPGQGYDVEAAGQMAEMKKHGRPLPGWITEWGSPAPPKVDNLPMSDQAYDKALEETAAGRPSGVFFSAGAGAALFQNNGKLAFAPDGATVLSEPEQARDLVRYYVLLLNEGVEKFTMREPYGPIAGQEPRLSGLSQAMISAELGQAKPAGRIPSASPSFRGYVFQTPKGLTAVCWTTSRRETVAFKGLPAGTGFFDLYGNPLDVKAGRKITGLELTGSPVYLTGVVQDIGVADPLKDVSVEWPGTVFAGDKVPVKISFANGLEEKVKVALSVAAPAGWKYELSSTNQEIAAGVKVEETLTLYIPASLEPGLRTVSLQLQCWSGDIATSLVNAGTLMVSIPTTCPPAPENFKVDGDLSEWQGREPLRIDSPRQIAWQTDELIAQQAKLWKGPADLSARVWYGWTADRFCVAIEAADDDVRLAGGPGKGAYQGDCVEIFLDGRAAGYRTSYGQGVYRMLWIPPVKPGDTGTLAKARDAAGVITAGKRTKDGYILEFSVPLTEENFPGFVAKSGAIFGFDLALDDLDSGLGVTRKIQMALNGTVRNYSDTSGFLRLRFGDTILRRDLITNPGFEDGAKGWKISNGAVVNEGGRNNGSCLKLEWNGQAGALAVQNPELDPDRFYALDFYYRISGTPGSSFINLNRSEKDVPLIPTTRYFFDQANNSDWAKGTMHIYSSRGGKADFEIRLHAQPFYGEGSPPQQATLLVDDVELRSLADSDLSGEMVENPGFEEGSPGAVPQGWSRGMVSAPMPKTTITDREFHSGKQSLEIAVGDPGEAAGNFDAFIRMSGTRRLEPGRKYILKFWSKSDREAQLGVVLTGPVEKSRQFVCTPAWQLYQMDIEFTPEQDSAPKYGRVSSVQFGGPLRQGNVRFYLDDVSLQAEK